MSTTLSMPTFAPMIADTPAHLADAKSTIEWLAISPDDPHLLDLLSDALAGKPAAILKTPQGEQGFLDGEFEVAVDRSLHQHEIKHIVLVGSTSSEPLDDQQEVDDPRQGSSEDSETIFDRLRAGACSLNANNRMAQESFACRVHQFLESASVQSRWSSGSLAVCGLFYRSCDGVLLTYDPDSKNFRPLVTY